MITLALSNPNPKETSVSGVQERQLCLSEQKGRISLLVSKTHTKIVEDFLETIQKILKFFGVSQNSVLWKPLYTFFLFFHYKI
ncbi:MAG: hypothetical protein Q7K45_06535 [Nanoarchaeota archaeon]|nr:hypothetical protein [Nanoarchaeota archaeon]